MLSEVDQLRLMQLEIERLTRIVEALVGAPKAELCDEEMKLGESEGERPFCDWWEKSNEKC